MDTQTTKKTLRPTWDLSYTLADKARKELETGSTTSVICPRCHSRPVLTVTPKGERSKIRCNCGYIYDAEIYL